MNNYKLQKQQGAALAMGMVLLLIISIIGVTSMKSALLQEKMSSGLKNRELADAAALSMMVEAERYLYLSFVEGNGTSIGLGTPYIVEPRSDLAYAFRTERNLNSGYDYLNGVSINSQFNYQLAAEPKFIIEMASSVNEGNGGGLYAETAAEADDNSAANSGQTNTGNEMKNFRIVTKATDHTGHNISAFESFMSVKDR